MADYSVSAELKAKIDRFKRPVRQAKKLIENYKKQAETIRDAKLTADASDVMKKSDRAKQAIKNFQKMKASGVLDLTTKALQRKLASTKKKLSDFGKISEKAKVDADVQGAITKTNRFKAMLRSIPNRKRVELNVSGNFMKMLSRARTQMDTFQQRMDRLATAVRTFGVLFGNAMKGFVVSNLTTIVPLIANAVPAFMALGNAVGTVGGGALGLASSLGAAGTGFGALMPFISMTMSNLANMAENLERGSAGWNKLSSTAQEAIMTYRNFGKRMREIKILLQEDIYKAFNNGAKGALDMINQLVPMLKGMAKATVGLSESFRKNINAKDVKPLFSYLETAAPRAFTNLAKAAGNFGVGLANVLKAFDPLAKYMEQGLLNMSKSFRNFAAQLENSENLKRFIEYVKTNLPLIGNIFGRTFKAIINMFASFSSNSSTIFEALDKMTQKFLKWSQTFAQSNGFQTFMQYIQETGPKVIALIGNLVQFFVSLGVALAPVGKVMLTVTNAVLSFMTSLLQSNKVVGIAIGVLTVISGIFMTMAPVVIALGTAFGPLIMRFAKVASKVGVLKASLMVASRAFSVLRVALLAFTGPVGITIALVTTLAVVIIKNWSKIKAFTVQAWSAIKNALTTALQSMGIDARAQLNSLIQFFVSLWQRAKQAFISGTQPLVNTLKQTWLSIQNSTRAALTMVITFVQQMWSKITSFWTQNGQQITQATQNLFNFVQQIFQRLSTNLAPIVQAGWQIITQIFRSSIQIASQVVRSGWLLIQTIFRSAWTLISGVVRAGTNIVLGIIKVFASLFTGDLRGMWEGAKMMFRGGTQAVVALAKAGWQLLAGATRAIWPLLVSIVQNGWRLLKTIFTSAFSALAQSWSNFWQNLRSLVAPILSAIVNYIKNRFIQTKNAIQSALQLAKSLIVAHWNTVKSIFTAAGQFLVNVVRNHFNRAKSAIQVALQSAKSIVTSIWSGIKTVFVSVGRFVVNTVRSHFNRAKSAVQIALSAAKNIAVSVWNSVKTATQAAVSATVIRVQRGFSKAKNAVQSALNAVRNIAQNIWSRVTSIVSNAISNTVNRITSGFNRARSIVSQVMSAVQNVIQSTWQRAQSIISGKIRTIKGYIRSGMSLIKNVIRSGMNLAKSIFRSTWSAITTIVRSGINRAKTVIQNGMNRAVNIIRNIGSKFKNAGAKIVSMLADGIKGAVGKVTGAIKGVVKKARDFLPFSPAKTGPLSDIHKLDFGGPMGGAIRKGAGKVVGPMRTMMGQARAAIDGSIPGIKKSGAWTSRGLADGIKSQKNRVQSASAAISKGVKSKMDAVLRIASPSKETFASGKFAGQGFYNGLKSMLKPIQNMAGSIADTVERSMKAATQAKKAQQSSSGGTGMWNNKAVRKYMEFVAEEGDWMNDWISQVPEAMKKAVMRKGFKLAGAVDGGHSDTSKKHVKRLLGAVPNTANLTSSLNKAANQKLGNSVAKKDQVNVYVEGNSEWLRAYVNSRNADEDVMKKF